MRKNLLQDLVADKPELTAVNPGPATRAAPLGSKGAVGAVSRALAQMSSDRSAVARETGDIVEIDTESIVESGFRDRLGDIAAGCASLLMSVRDTGQQVPILVRPAPQEQGKYQIAYGRRRVAVLRQLGRPVRALIRTMTDDEMIIAQGTENGARRNLSFIERSHFAWTLEGRGIERSIIMAALSVDKTELSRLISVMRSLPSDLVEWVGPAPKTGRRRWMDLAKLVEDAAGLERARQVVGVERSDKSRDSDGRFAVLFSAVLPKRVVGSTSRVWIDDLGRPLAQVDVPNGRFVISIDEVLEPTFGDYLLERLPELLKAFRGRASG